MHWCDNYSRQHLDFELIKITKGKRGRYYPYRDTMDAETYIHRNHFKVSCMW